MQEPSVKDKRRAVAAAVAAGGSFAVMDALVKTLTADYPVMQVVFLRSTTSLLMVLAALPWFGGWAALRMTRLPSHLLRACYAFIATVCFFYAFRHLPLADVYVVGHAAPFFVTALSVPLLGERVGPRRWAAVIIGFIGVLIVLQPWNSAETGAGAAATRDWTPWAAAVGAALFYALSVVQIRALSGSAGAAGMVVVFLGFAALAGAIISVPTWTPLALADYGLVALMGVFGVGGQVFMVLSYRLGPAALVAPFDYVALVWATALGFLLFGDVPTPAVVTGGAVIIAGGLYILHRETR
jgi:drug/metabolite transporter (DMT)-like permease